MLKEKNRKRVIVTYFMQSGETYRREEEYVPSHFTYDEIITHVLNNLRYSGMDLVINDSEDGVRPYVSPYLQKSDKIFGSSKGFR